MFRKCSRLAEGKQVSMNKAESMLLGCKQRVTDLAINDFQLSQVTAAK